MTGTNPSTGAPETHNSPETNEFGKALNNAAGAARPYTAQIIIAAVAVVAVLGAGLLWKRSADARQTIGWDEFYKCRAADDFSDLAQKYPDYSVGHWSLLTAGQDFLREGLSQSLVNREVSDERLNRAKTAFETLLKTSAKGELRERALYGLGTSLESLSDGNSKEAIDAYEQLLKENKNSQHRLAAEARIEALKNPEVGDFYSWFRKQNPKPEDRPTPQDRPAVINEDLFKELDLSEFSTDPADSNPAVEMPSPATEAPATEAPATEAPATEAPATEAPATEAGPTEETTPAQE